MGWALKQKDGVGNQLENNAKTEIRQYLSATTLKINGFNSSFKRHSLAEWMKKLNPMISSAEKILKITN